MLYAIICYNSETEVAAWGKEKDDAVMAAHQADMRQLAACRKLGPVARLMPTTTATTLRPGRETMVLDGPFAETKEQLLGFYVVDCETLEEAIEVGKKFMHDTGAIEVRPVMFYEPGVLHKAGAAAK